MLSGDTGGSDGSELRPAAAASLASTGVAGNNQSSVGEGALDSVTRGAASTALVETAAVGVAVTERPVVPDSADATADTGSTRPAAGTFDPPVRRDPAPAAVVALATGVAVTARVAVTGEVAVAAGVLTASGDAPGSGGAADTLGTGEVEVLGTEVTSSVTSVPRAQLLESRTVN